MDPNPFATPLRDMLMYLLYGAAGLGLVFLALALVRLWGMRTQKRGGGCGDVDLARLRRQLMAGEITPEEYEAVRRRLAGAEAGEAGPPSEATGRQSIQADEGPAGTPDGEAPAGGSLEAPAADRHAPSAGGEDDETSGRSRTDGET